MKLKKLLILGAASLSLTACGTPSITEAIEATGKATNFKLTMTYGEGNPIVAYADGDKIQVGEGDNAIYYYKAGDKCYYEAKNSSDGKWYKLAIDVEEYQEYTDNYSFEDSYNLAENENKFDFKDDVYTLRDGEFIEYTEEHGSDDNKFTAYYKILSLKIGVGSGKITLFEIEEVQKSDPNGEYGNDKSHVKIEFDYSKQKITIPEAEDYVRD